MRPIKEDKGRVRPVVEDDFQCDENGNSTRIYEVLSIVGYAKADGTKLGYISKTDVPIGIPITDTKYWYPFQVIGVPKGDKGDKGDRGYDGKSAYDLYIEHGGTITPVEAWIASLQGKDGLNGRDGRDGVDGRNGRDGKDGKDGKDGRPLQLRISSDGQSIEISSDGGETWYVFEKNFNKLRVLGYIDSISDLPRNANIGDIYGVRISDEELEEEYTYNLYINTVTGWNLDYTITKVYDYDTELPSSAANGTTVLVPVSYLTLDKEKIDGYKVYRFSLEKNGWVLILDTAEIYASKEDIINHGDNVYALVQGDEEHTYKLYRRVVGWVYFGTNASITYVLVQDIDEGTETNILSGKAVTDAYGRYIESPEFVRAYLDGEDKILWGIRTDGTVYFGAGVPPQVKDYIEERIGNYNDVITFLDDLEEGDETLRELLNGKVDKEEGKSLIDEEYAEGVHYIENSEFIKVELDKEDKVLEGIRNDGTKVIGGDLFVNGNTKVIGETEIGGVLHKVTKNPEFVEVKRDKDDRILEAIMLDGTKLLPAGYDIDGNTLKTIDNPEFIDVKLDFKGKILEGLYKNGTKVIGGNLNVEGDIKIKDNIDLLKYIDSRKDQTVTINVSDIIEWADDSIICANQSYEIYGYYGKLVKNTPTSSFPDYKASRNFIPLMGARRIELPVLCVYSGSMMGTMFYSDQNDCSIVGSYIHIKTSSASIENVNILVPEGAKYVRVTYLMNPSGHPYYLKLFYNGLDSLNTAIYEANINTKKLLCPFDIPSMGCGTKFVSRPSYDTYCHGSIVIEDISFIIVIYHSSTQTTVERVGYSYSVTYLVIDKRTGEANWIDVLDGLNTTKCDDEVCKYFYNYSVEMGENSTVLMNVGSLINDNYQLLFSKYNALDNVAYPLQKCMLVYNGTSFPYNLNNFIDMVNLLYGTTYSHVGNITGLDLGCTVHYGDYYYRITSNTCTPEDGTQNTICVLLRSSDYINWEPVAKVTDELPAGESVIAIEDDKIYCAYRVGNPGDLVYFVCDMEGNLLTEIKQIPNGLDTRPWIISHLGKILLFYNPHSSISQFYQRNRLIIAEINKSTYELNTLKSYVSYNGYNYYSACSRTNNNLLFSNCQDWRGFNISLRQNAITNIGLCEINAAELLES